MKKMLALLVLVLAIGAPMVSSADECTSTDIGRACTTDNGVAVDGAEGNPDPLDGFITINTEEPGGCASDGGDYDDPEEDRTCL